MDSSDRKTPVRQLTSSEEVRSRTAAILDEYIAVRAERAKGLAPRYEALWRAMAEVIHGGGKRMRPYLMVLAYEMYSGKSDERILRAATALEMLHQAMLMHDDVIDRDYTRHGKPNVAGIFQKQYTRTHTLSSEDKTHLSHAAAILAGDLAIAASYDLVRSSGLPASDVLMLEAMLDEAIFTVGGGELLDTEAVGTDMAKTDIQAIVVLKTASYSFVVPLVSGAQLARAGEADIEALRMFGQELGTAFQLVDDLLGVFGDETKTGKSVISDIEEGKHTFLAQYALVHASTQERRTLTVLLGKKNITPEEAETVRTIFVSTNAKQACELLVSEHAAKAHDILDELAIPKHGYQALEKIIDKVVQREH